HEEEAEANQKEEGRSIEKDNDPIATANFLDLDHHALVTELLGDIWRGFLEYADVELAIRGASVLALQLVDVLRDVESDFANIACFDFLHEFAVAGLLFAGLRAVVGDKLPENHAQKDDKNPEQNCFCRGTRIHVTLTKPLNCRNPSARLGARLRA